MKGLNVIDLESGYDKNLVIRNISFSVRPKETLMLMGPSGSGKSTLLLTILGIIAPIKGKIFLNETEITHLPIEARNIGYLPQDYGLFPHLNVIENVTYGLYVRSVSKKEREDVASEILTLVELQGFEKRSIQGLSGGQKQRVGLARALAIKPNLFLLDEPLSHIDQVTKSDVAKELKNLFYKVNIPIILVTHNHEDALLLSKDIAILIDGKIEQIGIRDEIIKNPKTPFIKKLLLPFTISE
jgi:ABC-type Fe3+/spermidine/putrescine transport system ATPase subunit